MESKQAGRAFRVILTHKGAVVVAVENVGGGYRRNEIMTDANKTKIKNWSAEAQECYNNGIMALDTFCHPTTGGLALTLRKAAEYFKAAADRMDFVERLKKNTLQDFVKEIKKEAESK